MKTRIIYIACFLLLIVTLDKLIGTGLKKLYSVQEVGTAGQLNYTFFKMTADIVILGNSRAQHHYNDKLISKTIGLSCYNAGVDGGYGIWLPYASADAVLNRYRPKLFIVEFNPISMGLTKGSHEKLAVLLPFIQKLKICRSLAEQRSSFEKVKWISSIYPYNSQAYALIAGKLFENKLQHVKGFMPIWNRTLSPAPDQGLMFKQYSDEPDDLNMASLTALLKLCRDDKVNIVFVNSPVFADSSLKFINETPAAKGALKLINDSGFQYWDFSGDPRMVSNADFFADPLHLNQMGAEYFTSLVIEKLLKKNS